MLNFRDGFMFTVGAGVGKGVLGLAFCGGIMLLCGSFLWWSDRRNRRRRR